MRASRWLGWLIGRRRSVWDYADNSPAAAEKRAQSKKAREAWNRAKRQFIYIEVRKAALEEAAQLCDTFNEGQSSTANELAEGIRKLKEIQK